ncbi:hypothetical protein CARUB_v10011286mg [Capsella rubella]|uniref:Uncharacterized protein n=1 Tax=Capsella rubella TaxID=81985 RepID=R0I935_9BRAS|nr:hypothetical protein CARUB_v10011286mg [Capsella rubella]
MSGNNNAHKILDYFLLKIERCIQKYMSLEQTMNDLYEHDQIPHHITKAIWEQLERDIPEFFNRYKKLCELVRQIAMFNELLSQQRDLMQEFTATAPPVTELHKPNDDHQDQIHEEWFDSSDFVFGDDDSFSSFDFMDSFGATDDSIASLIDQSTFPATTHSDPSTSFAATPQSDPPASNGLRYDIDCDAFGVGTSSLVTLACDPSGDNKVMEHWVDLIGPGSGWAIYWPAHSKSGVENRRRLREAGFTEQRSPPAFDGGRITGRCLPSPL